MLGLGKRIHHQSGLYCKASSYHLTCKCRQVSLWWQTTSCVRHPSYSWRRTWSFCKRHLHQNSEVQTWTETLTFIMFFNLYPLSNTGFINLGRAQFLCDLINRTPIDICTHIFQTIGKTIARSAAKVCLPFCSLVMKIMLNEGVRPPSDGKIVVCHCLISISSLEKSKSHSSAEKKKKNLSTPPVSLSGHESVAYTTETTSSHVPAPPTVGT